MAEAAQYLVAHGVDRALVAAVEALLRERPANPWLFLADTIGRRRRGEPVSNDAPSAKALSVAKGEEKEYSVPEFVPTCEYADAVFDEYDADGNGFLDKNEFAKLVTAVAVKMGATALPTEAEVTELLRTYDTNKDGKISRDEFGCLVNELFPTVSL